MQRLTTAEYAGPANNYSNSGRAKMYVAVHNTANDATPAEEASYARRRTDNVSAHVVADNIDVLQLLDLDLDSWHAGSTWGNQRAVSFELKGRNTWTDRYWRAVIDRIAPTVAEVCKLYAIPVRHLTVEEARKKVMKGIVTHNDMRLAWGGTTHTDPGPNFPMQYLLDRVTEELNMATTQEQYVTSTAWRLAGMMELKPSIDNHVNNPNESNELGRAIVRIDKATIAANAMLIDIVAQLAAIAARLTAIESQPLDYDELAKALLRNMAPEV